MSTGRKYSQDVHAQNGSSPVGNHCADNGNFLKEPNNGSNSRGTKVSPLAPASCLLTAEDV